MTTNVADMTRNVADMTRNVADLTRKLADMTGNLAVIMLYTNVAGDDECVARYFGCPVFVFFQIS